MDSVGLILVAFLCSAGVFLSFCLRGAQLQHVDYEACSRGIGVVSYAVGRCSEDCLNSPVEWWSLFPDVLLQASSYKVDASGLQSSKGPSMRHHA